MFVVGEVFPIGGVVPGVVLGVVDGVVGGVAPVVVFGVVPVVVLGVVGEAVGIATGVLGGHSVLLLDGVLGEGFGMVALGLVAEGLDVLIEALDEVEGLVGDTGHAVAGVDCAAGDAGVVLRPLLLALEDCEAGTTGVGVMAPVGGEVVWAAGIPMAKQRTAAIKIARLVIQISPVWFTPWDGASANDGCSAGCKGGALG